MRTIDSRSPTNPLVAIAGDLRASLLLDPALPEAINRMTAAIEQAESAEVELAGVGAQAVIAGETKRGRVS
jgi:hypothetical protein